MVLSRNLYDEIRPFFEKFQGNTRGVHWVKEPIRPLGYSSYGGVMFDDCDGMKFEVSSELLCCGGFSNDPSTYTYDIIVQKLPWDPKTTPSARGERLSIYCAKSRITDRDQFEGLCGVLLRWAATQPWIDSHAQDKTLQKTADNNTQPNPTKHNLNPQQQRTATVAALGIIRRLAELDRKYPGRGTLAKANASESAVPKSTSTESDQTGPGQQLASQK